jgi:hypothetical protein
MDEDLKKGLEKHIKNKNYFKRILLCLNQNQYDILEQNAKRFKTNRTTILKFLIENNLPYTEPDEL